MEAKTSTAFERGVTEWGNGVRAQLSPTPWLQALVTRTGYKPWLHALVTRPG